MAYKLTSADSQKIVFKRTSVIGGAIVAVIMGSIFVGVGVVVHFGLEAQETSLVFVKILFPFFGLMAIVAGLQAPKNARKTTPEIITFDNTKGAVIIEMAAGTREVGYIPYSEIDKFDIYVQRSSSNKSTHYTYHTLLRKRDGGEWFLTQPNSQKQAVEMIEKLNKEVDLTKPFTITTPPFITTKIARQEGMEKTIIHWQNNVSLMAPVLLAIFVALIITLISLLFSMETDSPGAYFGGFSLGIFFLIIFAIMYFSVKHMIKQATTKYAVAIGTNEVEYYEFSKSTGTMRNKKSIPLTDVKGVVYTFSSSVKRDFSSGLKILTERDMIAQQEAAKDPMVALKNLLSRKNKPLTLAINSLTPVECLQLENWLQDLIKKKGHEQVM